MGCVALGFATSYAAGTWASWRHPAPATQQVACLLDYAGLGVSQLIGVGGLDLSAAVAGRSTIQALGALGADPGTTDIITVSKPAPAEVNRSVRAAAQRLGKRVIFCIPGPGQPSWPTAGVRERQRRPGYLSGIFSGGTLADEAMLITSGRLGEVRSNIPLSPELRIDPAERATTHVIIDFGDDELTRGRPHPMIDPSRRL